MIIWLIFFVLVGLIGWLGLRLGAVRQSISLFGGIMAVWAGAKFGPKLMPLFAKFADGNPLLLLVAPTLILFLVIYLVFTCLAYVVGDKVYMYYKYKTIDEKRMAWERMNRNAGLCVGIANGIWHFAMVGLFAYSLGYWTLQLDGSSEDPNAQKAGSVTAYSSSAKPAAKAPGGGGGADTLIKVANPLRKALTGSGFERFIAALDPFPDKFYDLADCVGIIYKNPTAARRFLSYPGTLGISEAPEFQAIVNDETFQKLWASQPNLKALLTTAQSRAIFKNQALLKQILSIDAKDAYQYVLEGKSDKFKGEPLLGRWDIHVPSTAVEAGKNNPGLTADLNTLYAFRGAMKILIKDVSLVATPESQIFVKASLDDQKPLVDLITGKVPSVRTNTPFAKVVATGTWKKEAGEGKYSVTFSSEAAKAETIQVEANNSLNMSFFGGTVVFSKAD